MLTDHSVPYQIPSITIGYEKAESDIMNRPPRQKSEKLVNFQVFALAYFQIGFIQGNQSSCVSSLAKQFPVKQWPDFSPIFGLWPRTDGCPVIVSLLSQMDGFSRIFSVWNIRKNWDSQGVNNLMDSYHQEWVRAPTPILMKNFVPRKPLIKHKIKFL